MPLPTGLWKVTANGAEGNLTIAAPDQNGMFSGDILGKRLTGLWNEVSQSITFRAFIRQGPTDADPVVSVAVFKGILFRVPSNPEPGRDVLATLTGTFQVTDGSPRNPPFPVDVTSRRNVFGWFAQITEIQ